MHPALLSSLLNGSTYPVCSLESRGHSPAPVCAGPSPGGSWEKAILSRAMSRKLILTKRCRVTLARRKDAPRMYPHPPRRHQAEIREPPYHLAFPSSQAMLSAHGSCPSSPHQSSVICLQTPWDWLPSTPVTLCCQQGRGSLGYELLIGDGGRWDGRGQAGLPHWLPGDPREDAVWPEL